jgi:hypothetical protein
LDTATDHGCLSSLATHILGVKILCFADQLLSLIEALLRDRSVHLLGTLEFCFLRSGKTSAGTTSETCCKNLGSYGAESLRERVTHVRYCTRQSSAECRWCCGLSINRSLETA